MTYHFASVKDVVDTFKRRAVTCRARPAKSQESKRNNREAYAWEEAARMIEDSNLVNFVEKVEEPGDDS